MADVHCLTHKYVDDTTLSELLPRGSPDSVMQSYLQDLQYWWPTLVIACSPLDAGQTDVMIDRHDVPILGTQNAHS